ncbi:MAG: hypothetical protein ABL951_09240 [Alphaproteobacteria bacterium]
MRSRFAAGLLLTLALLTGAPAFALDAGQTVTGSVRLGGISVPLPDGEWTAYYAVEDKDEKFQTSKLGLVLINGKAIKQTAYFRVSRSKVGAGFKPYEQCAQPYYFYGETTLNQIGGAQDCWHVLVETLAPDDASDRQKAILEFAKSRGVFLPLAAIGSRFHRASPEVLLQASYGWTPDLIVKAPKDIKVWRFQDWTAEAVAKDPRKKVIMTKFKRWGEEWRPQIDTAFSGFGKK